ncbi:MAG: DHH family phosphoesterase [Candidatus Peribacteria bacterium]|nr:MAG: DHH family phosphoesterase [Candidatus Peribacteria bacterium]
MPQVTSIQGNSIRYDESTLEKSIQAVLLERIDASELEEKGIADLYDPYLLTGMHEAVDRIKQAKEQGEKIMIFGDYDVDGVTSTSILMHFFKTVGIPASYRLPHRVHDGYGLKKYFIDEIADLGVTLIITVDCGTRDIEVIQYAKSKGVDVIVTDHHAVPEIIPTEAVAIINPKREDCHYPSKNLAGAGVAFKLMSALAKEMLPADKYLEYIGESIDIAAIGTVADCMSLTGENRIIVTEGLKQLKRTRSRGIRALIEDKIHEDLDSDVFGFVIGPRLNAAGRMDTPYKAVNLILNNSETLEETLRDIEELNEKRKMMTKQFVEQALESVSREDNILFYESAEIEHGIIGIVAGRLTEQFYRPAIVLIDDGEKLVASCRSPEFFSIVELLEKHRDFFVAF